MSCQNCRKRRQLQEHSMKFAGMTITVNICGDCLAGFEKIQAFAGAFPAANGSPAGTSARPRKQVKIDPKFEAHALSQEEIARTQSLRPAVRLQDTPQKRQLDDVDLMRLGLRARVFCYTQDSAMNGGRNKHAMKLLEKQLRVDQSRIRIVRDSGSEVIGEVICDATETRIVGPSRRRQYKKAA